MDTTTATLITIVAEAVLKERLIAELQTAGARGWTLTEAQGEGCRHRRVGELLGENIRIESIVSPSTAARMLDRLMEEYFPRFAVIAWTSPVQVLRGEKYV